jgi:16S rRNA G966 N2-methylase RsmD
MKNLLDNLKENNQDFEFYPTNSRMIATICNYFGRQLKDKTILDIGAGNGNFFTKLEIEIKKVMDISIQNGAHKRDVNFNIHKFAIEKSEILIEQMPNDITIIGADFQQQTLIDKDFDYIFCNPPYGEFKEWMHKIINETNSNDVIMIVPSRWTKDDELLALIKKREFTFKIIGNDDFLDGERQARAYVDIIHFSRLREKQAYDRENRESINQSFIDFFEDQFGESFKNEKEKELKEKLEDAKENELVAGNNTVETLCNLYDIEFKKLLNSYKAIAQLGEATLKDIGLDKKKILSSLHYKISNLKKEYWRYLINNTDKITSRLIHSTRDKLIKKITVSIGSIDFNEKNVYAIVIWIIKNANKSYDEQLLFMFDICIEPANVKKYKSNQKVFETEENRWGSGAGTRFKNKEEVNNITLDYRIITSINDYRYGYTIYYRQSKENQVIQDWETICNNLLGHKNFGEIKFYKNNNCHIKFNVDFAKAFNIQASLLKGWIKDKRQAKEEFAMKITDEDLNFNYFQINKNNFLLLA